MKKSLKRGFFLPETIVVIVVVVVILLNVYVTFASVYSNYRRSFKYNTLNALNASYSLKKYYESVDGLSSNELELNNYIFDITTNEKFDSSFYEKIKLNYEIEKIYLINPTKVQANLSNLNVNLRRYIKTLKNNTEIGIVIVTKNGEYSFAPINISKTLNCTYSGDLSVGAEFTDAQYTYRYKQQYNGSTWENISLDGWGVKLTDLDLILPVTTKICSNINNKPIVSTSYMFYNSKAESIDLSGFDTSNVVNMRSMFQGSVATYLDLSNLDTSNVTNMTNMFTDSKALYINMDNLDTSKVTTMEGMFGRTNAPVLDLSNFNTSNVTNMKNMFLESKATSINVSSFDTSKVTTMEGMFARVNASVLDLSSFNTSNVTNMYNMFLESKATSINVSNLDTSKVTNMQGMFARSGVKSLDLSSFNTSNVTNFNLVFENASATNGYARTQADAEKFNSSSSKPNFLLFRTKLPSGYNEVEYIQSTGTQYIDTGYYWQHENIRIYFDGTVITNSSNQSLFGNEENTASSGDARNFGGIPHGNNGNYRLFIGNGSISGLSVTLGNRFTLNIVTTTSKNVNAYVNGTSAISTTYSGSVMTYNTIYKSSNTSTNVGNIFIFANHNTSRGSSNAAMQHIGAMRLYAFKMYDNDVLVRDFVPCYYVSGSNNVIGLYDTVTQSFYANGSSTAFEMGPTV